MSGLYGDGRTEEVAGRFRVVSELGQGGTANVYLAIADGPSGFQKLVVLKILKRSLCADPEFRAMFLNEARLAARLRHSNIVQTNEVLELDGTPALVMEYLEGQPLSHVITRGRADGFTLAMQVQVLIDALTGLHAAHELTDFNGASLGVVHRDVSPQNLFVTTEGQAKVLDFGIAKLSRDLAALQTAVGTIKGKLRYMAPEQIAGDSLDRRADIYAAGVILWEALAGERMWRGISEEEVKERVRTGRLPLADCDRGRVPIGLERICRQALSLRPCDRPATALELADRLEEIQPQLGPAVSRRQIGATVARLFQDMGTETRNAIGRKISDQGKGAVDAAIDRRTPLAGAAPVFADGAALNGPTPAGPAQRDASRRVVQMLVAGVVLSAALVGVRVVGLLGQDEKASGGDSNPQARPAHTGASPHSAASLPARGSSASPVSSLAFRDVPSAAQASEGAMQTPVSARTASAALLVFAKTVGPDAARTEHRLIRPRRAKEIALHVGQASAATTEAAGPLDGTAGGPQRDCDHPFFVDRDGIKKFRPECM